MRDAILDAAEQMVQDRGLNAVSFQHLADAVGLSKPSVFHHFPNKEALAAALVDRCQSKYGPEYAHIIDDARSAPDKLRAIAALFETGLRNDRLCLLGTIGHDVATLTPTVQDDLRLAVSRTIDRYARVFEQGRVEASLQFRGEPTDAAAAFLGMLEGLQVLARARRDHALFRAATDSYVDSLLT